MATVTNTIKLPGGTAPARARVEIRLLAAEGETADEAGWITATDVTVLSLTQPTVTAGVWSADLVPNANITPAGTVYRVDEFVGRDRYTHFISVGSGGGNLADLLTDVPGALASGPLAAHIGDSTAAHAATAISYSGTLAATNVNAALDELDAQTVTDERYHLADYGTVDTTGATASDAALVAALAAMEAANGGTLVFPAGIIRLDNQVAVPNNGLSQPKQKAARWLGQGSWWSGRSSAAAAYGGTILDLRYNGSEACILTKGEGVIEFVGITFTQMGTAHTTPYLKTTNTTLLPHHCAFLGHSSKAAATADQDCIILGGTDNSSFGGSANSQPFQGYGTVIAHNYFNRVQRGVYGRVYANALVVRDNTWWAQCGGVAAIEFAAGNGVDYCVGGEIAGNLIECVGYDRAIVMDYCQDWVLSGNSFYDAAGITDGYIHLTNSQQNVIIPGHFADHPLITPTSSTGNVVIGNNGNIYRTGGGMRFDDTIGVNTNPIATTSVAMAQNAASDSLLGADLLATPTGKVLNIRTSTAARLYEMLMADASLLMRNTQATPTNANIEVAGTDGTVLFQLFNSSATSLVRAGHTGFAGDAQVRVRGNAGGYYFDSSNGLQCWLIYRTSGATQGELYTRDLVNGRMHQTLTAGASADAARSSFDSRLIVGGSANVASLSVAQTAGNTPAARITGHASASVALQQWANSGATVLAQVTHTGALDMLEQVEPAAPSANSARIWCQDNGSGKSQLCVRFASGAVQVIATEP
jgi:hypothetical protein